MHIGVAKASERLSHLFHCRLKSKTYTAAQSCPGQALATNTWYVSPPCSNAYVIKPPAACLPRGENQCNDLADLMEHGLWVVPMSSCLCAACPVTVEKQCTSVHAAQSILGALRLQALPSIRAWSGFLVHSSGSPCSTYSGCYSSCPVHSLLQLLMQSSGHAGVHMHTSHAGTCECMPHMCACSASHFLVCLVCRLHTTPTRS